MDRSTLKALVVAIVALMVVVLIAGMAGGGISSETSRLARQELQSLDSQSRELQAGSQTVSNALRDHARLFDDSTRTAWKERLKDAEQQLAAADRAAAEARALLEENDPEHESDLVTTIDRVRSARETAVAEIGALLNAARRRVEFAKDRPAFLARVKTHLQTVEGIDLDGLRAEVSGAANRWEQKSADLNRRLQLIAKMVDDARTASTLANSQNEAFEKDPATADLDAFFAADRSLNQLAADAPQAISNLRERIAQLDVSWDEMLVDMEIVESGNRYQFFHSIKRVTTPAVVGSEDEGAEAVAPTEETRRVSVNSATFKRHEKDLGMVLRHKPAGKYDDEAEASTQPPGYAYMAEPGQRNRYGYWQNRGGSSFWVWYGQYSLMRNLFYGPTYYPVRASSWSGYHRSRTTGRTFYGTDTNKPRWGSGGSYTSSRYASSSYKRNSGYSGTKWRGSGGSFRSSPYRASSRSSSGRGGYRSFRSGGSRSFGGK